MGILFLRNRTYRIVSLLLYIVSTWAFFEVLQAHSSAEFRLLVFICGTLPVLTHLWFLRRRGDLEFPDGAAGEIFSHGGSYRRRPFIIQTVLGTAVTMPTNLFVNVWAIEYLQDKISTVSLIVLWLLSIVSIADLFMILIQVESNRE